MQSVMICLEPSQNRTSMSFTVEKLFDHTLAIPTAIRRAPRPNFPEVEMKVLPYLLRWTRGGKAITDERIRQQALKVAQSLGLSDDYFKGSHTWVENFKIRQGIQNEKWERIFNVNS